MAFTNYDAADKLKELRETAGLSPEGLARAIRDAAETAPWGDRGCVDAHTIRRIERRGHVPGPRVRFVISHFYGVPMHEIWNEAKHRVAVAA